MATKKFLIGREQDCHLRPNSELVSRHHCVFAVDDFSVRIRDLGSTNGTYVNDQRVRGEAVLNSGDRIRVGKLDFELVVGEPLVEMGTNGAKPAAGDSALRNAPPVEAATTETSPLATSDTSFEIPVPAAPEDTGSSILQPDSDTSVPVPPAPPTGDSTVVWSPPAAPGYPQAPEPYPPMGMPYPQAPYQPAYPYMPPGYGYQPPMNYPQIPMGYPGMYPQMGMYPSAPSYAPPQQPAQPAIAEDEPIEESASMPTVRLPDPKTTGAKAPPPPPPPAAEAPKPAEPQMGDNGEPILEAKKEEKKPEAPPAKPSQKAADILKSYIQRPPV